MMFVAAAGTAMAITCFHDATTSENLGGEKSSRFSRKRRIARDTMRVQARAMTVAMAAPASSSRGNPSNPKMSSGSSTRFKVMAPVMMRAGILVSPRARIDAFATIGTTRKTIPGYQMIMYSLMSGRTSSEAPSARNSGSIVSIPMAARTRTTMNASSRLSEDTRLTMSVSPRPIARETTETVPVLSPMATPKRTDTTGNVKLIAASSRVPNCDTK